MIPAVEREGTAGAPDGRTLAFVERGAAEGVPVIVCHGTPGAGSRDTPTRSCTSGTAFAMVAYDRPGYGRSDPMLGRSVADAAADIEAIADELGFERFAVVGGSGGAPHALACGALLGDRVLRVGALVTPAPSDTYDFDFFAGLAELNVKEFNAALEGPEAIEAFVQPYVDESRATRKAWSTQIAAELPEVDREIASREEYRAITLESFVEAVRQGVRGWADDDLAFAKPWGFEPEDVTAEVRALAGRAGRARARSHGEYVASRLPNARFEMVEGSGHFLVDEWATVLDWLTAGAGLGAVELALGSALDRAAAPAARRRSASPRRSRGSRRAGGGSGRRRGRGAARRARSAFRRRVLGGGGGVERRGLDVLVSRERVRVGAVGQQETRRLDVAEEAREAERLEAVVAEGARRLRILAEELREPVVTAEGGGLEHCELGIGREQLGDPVLVAAVERFEQFRHEVLSSLDVRA